MRFSAVRPASLLVLGVALLSACTTKVVPSPASAAPQAFVAPTMTIERFLRAVNQKDLDTMAQLFGTRDGSVTRAWPKKEQDERMFFLAEVLRHSDYTIGPEQMVPGRREEAALYTVTLTKDNRTVDVPFTVVRSQQAPEWLVEKVGIDNITRTGR